MKHLVYSMLFSAYALIVVPAHAHVPVLETGEDVCQEFAFKVEAAANLRDRLHKKEDLLKDVEEMEKGTYQNIATMAVNYAFQYPRLPPQEHANEAYNRCIELLL